MTVWQALLLGIIQGLTEFLPISSSGHLVIAQAYMGMKEPELLFDISVHFATLIAVVVYFRKELLRLIKSLFISGDRPAQLTILSLVLGTLPAVVVGLTLRDFLESLFSSPRITALMLIFTGLILLSSIFARSRGKKFWGMNWLDAFVVGVGQAVAILPGISRSGATITTGLSIGMEKEDSARFSFLLAIPAILGASILELKDLTNIEADRIFSLIVGMLSAGIIGYLSVSFML